MRDEREEDERVTEWTSTATEGEEGIVEEVLVLGEAKLLHKHRSAESTLATSPSERTP